MSGDVVYFDGVRYKFSGAYYQRGNVKTGERFLHRAVWVYAKGSIPDGYVIHHIDEDTRNNAIENLEMMLASDHHKHHFGEMWEARRSDENVFRAAVEKNSQWHRSAAGKKFLSEMNAKNRSEGKFDNKDKTAFYAGRDAWLKTVECRESNRIHMLKLHELGKVSAPSKEALGKAAEWHSSADGLKWHSDNGVASWKNRKPTEKICEVCLSTYTTFYPNRSKFCGNNCKATALRRRRKE